MEVHPGSQFCPDVAAPYNLTPSGPQAKLLCNEFTHHMSAPISFAQGFGKQTMQIFSKLDFFVARVLWL